MTNNSLLSRASRLAIASVALLIASAVVPPAAASSFEWDEGTSAVEEVSYVVGGVEVEPDSTEPLILPDRGRALSDIQALLPELRIVGSWVDHRFQRVYLRAGAADKIRIKHNVTPGLARLTTQYPDSSSSGGGTSWIYNTTVQRIVGGRIEAQVVVKTVVELGNRQADGLSYGLVTSYCLGTVLCPAWTNNIIGG